MHDINRLLNETAAKERAIDEELEELFTHRSQLERSVSSLNASTSQVSLAFALHICPHLLVIVSQATHVGIDISLATKSAIRGARTSCTAMACNLFCHPACSSKLLRRPAQLSQS